LRKREREREREKEMEAEKAHDKQSVEIQGASSRVQSNSKGSRNDESDIVTLSLRLMVCEFRDKVGGKDCRYKSQNSKAREPDVLMCKGRRKETERVNLPFSAFLFCLGP
jgi:hypothetical protein